MNSNNQNDSLIYLKRLSANDDYYNIVFKKTERVASAVFYMLAHVELNDRTKVHYNNLSDKAMALHEAVIASLNLYEYEARDKMYPLQQALVVMGSALHIATASRLITSDMESVVAEEIDAVLRYIRNHYVNEAASRISITADTTKPKSAPRIPRRARPNIPANDFSSDAVLVYSDLGDRTARIKTVLEAKPEATIKDLSEIITDVSTKTIQRDLNSLIESGEVIRQGERRWSKYSIAK
jgi:DeoR-like helix-turn-helix domain